MTCMKYRSSFDSKELLYLFVGKDTVDDLLSPQEYGGSRQMDSRL